jgi:Zn-dependent protease
MSSEHPGQFNFLGEQQSPASPEVALAGFDPAKSTDSLIPQILTELDQSPEQKTWVQAAVLLVVSLFVFSTWGLFSFDLPELLLLVGVLLLHETGHYLGMRLFDYQDVRMFFIPFFGAAVSGRSTKVVGYQEAIVILLGPLPGIALGLGVGVAGLNYDNELLRSAARMLLFINGFNLLPFLPLDGGRLLHLVLFSRQRHLEALFRFVTGVLLALCGWGLDAWVLIGLGAVMALTTGYTFRVSTLAQQLRGRETPTTEINLSARIPPEQALPLVTAVRAAFPTIKQPKPAANTARQVWERMHVRPPGAWASVALLSVYLASLLATLLFIGWLETPVRTVVSRTNADGTFTSVEEIRVWGQLRLREELNADQQRYGRFVEYAPPLGRMTVEGSYVDGLEDGTWKFYGPDEQVLGTTVFEHGRLIKHQGQVPASFRETKP